MLHGTGFVHPERFDRLVEGDSRLSTCAHRSGCWHRTLCNRRANVKGDELPGGPRPSQAERSGVDTTLCRASFQTDSEGRTPRSDRSARQATSASAVKPGRERRRAWPPGPAPPLPSASPLGASGTHARDESERCVVKCGGASRWLGWSCRRRPTRGPRLREKIDPGEPKQWAPRGWLTHPGARCYRAAARPDSPSGAVRPARPRTAAEPLGGHPRAPAPSPATGPIPGALRASGPVGALGQSNG
jgi:hypothetical protein